MKPGDCEISHQWSSWKPQTKASPLNVQPTAAPMQDRSLVNLHGNRGIVTWIIVKMFVEVRCSSKRIQMNKELRFFYNHLCRFFSENNKSILLSPVCKAILLVLISFSIPYLSAPWLCQVLADFPSACVSREAKEVGVGVKGINSSGHIGSGFTPRNITAATRPHWSHGGSDHFPF